MLDDEHQWYLGALRGFLISWHDYGYKVSVHFRTSYSHLRSRDKLCTHHYRRVIWQSELTATLHNGSN